MICDSDPELGMATQLSGIIKLLVDPENMLAATVVNVCIILIINEFIIWPKIITFNDLVFCSKPNTEIRKNGFFELLLQALHACTHRSGVGDHF